MNFESLQSFLWPRITDAESARKAAEQGFYSAMLYVFMGVTPILMGHVGKVFDIIVVSLCGVFTKKLWRTAAVLGLCMTAPEIVFALPDGVSFRLASAVLLTLMFVNAVRGTFMWHRYVKTPPAPTVEIVEPPQESSHQEPPK